MILKNVKIDNSYSREIYKTLEKSTKFLKKLRNSRKIYKVLEKPTSFLRILQNSWEIYKILEDFVDFSVIFIMHFLFKKIQIFYIYNHNFFISLYKIWKYAYFLEGQNSLHPEIFFLCSRHVFFYCSGELEL